MEKLILSTIFAGALVTLGLLGYQRSERVKNFVQKWHPAKEQILGESVFYKSIGRPRGEIANRGERPKEYEK